MIKLEKTINMFVIFSIFNVNFVNINNRKTIIQNLITNLKQL